MAKIKYGIKNVHYAIATIAADGTATYGDPVALPGAVSMSLEAQGENTPFYADDIVYWVGNGNNGYSGDVELALIPDSFREDVLNEIKDTKNVLVEDLDAQIVHFALMGQFSQDTKAKRWVFYNCTATRPQVSGQTKGESIEPQTETITVTATSIHHAGLDKDIIKASTTEETDTTAYSAWMTAVYNPTP